jgi:hypothetical protein
LSFSIDDSNIELVDVGIANLSGDLSDFPVVLVGNDQLDWMVLVENPADLVVVCIIVELFNKEVVGLCIEHQNCASKISMKNSEKQPGTRGGIFHVYMQGRCGDLYNCSSDDSVLLSVLSVFDLVHHQNGYLHREQLLLYLFNLLAPKINHQKLRKPLQFFLV